MLHGEVALDIAQEIKITLTPEEQERRLRERPVNPEAHEAYLRGQFHVNKLTHEGIIKGIKYFQQAVKIDPNYALGYTGLARVYNIMTYITETEPKKAFLEAKAATKKALEIDESLAEAHFNLAWILAAYEWD
jgi:Tfp pilus assembly protein PilF